MHTDERTGNDLAKERLRELECRFNAHRSYLSGFFALLGVTLGLLPPGLALLVQGNIEKPTFQWDAGALTMSVPSPTFAVGAGILFVIVTLGYSCTQVMRMTEQNGALLHGLEDHLRFDHTDLTVVRRIRNVALGVVAVIVLFLILAAIL